ncbi:hypothetical protein [Mycobacterium sp. 94-17]|uniref:hypothetical protein n=1 Tax=Mycobacterium sp. 94-17 TaxID=2986147 RepID=UPI002D1F0610|nr:hypothetical protein [Mycobacterium sp. 94-17]MEB4211496.1 hypothetical protein [Mycobacterium sp. 94-17]
MSLLNVKTRAALCGCVAAFVVAAGLSTAGAPAATASSSDAPSAPGGAVRVQPAGGGGCIIGLNCGCVRKVTCPTPHPRHPNVENRQHLEPGPAEL